MSFRLTLVSRDATGVVHAAAAGNATARDFATPESVHFDTILGKNWGVHQVILDMDEVPFIDSSAIGWLIHAQKTFRGAGGRLVLHSVQPQVRNILTLLKLERVVPIAQDAASAAVLLAPAQRTVAAPVA
jgi:anti-anti-sigma factor